MNHFPLSAVVEHKTGSPSGLVFYVDYKATVDFSFRRFLDSVMKALNEVGNASVVLPPYEKNEDFIFGSLAWGLRQFDVYYEYALGYVQFECGEAESIILLKDALSHLVLK